MRRDDVWKRKSLLFLKKKKQKDFSVLNPEMVPDSEKGKKFFGSFFQERTAFVAHCVCPRKKNRTDSLVSIS